MSSSLQGRKSEKKKVAPWVQSRVHERQVQNWEQKLLSQRPVWRAHDDGRGGDSHWVFFCPLCRTQRVLPMSPRPESWRNILRVLVTTGTLTSLLWPWLGVKGVFLMAPVWMAFEFAYRLYLRAKVACRECGFDAYLYLSDLPRAREEVEKFWKNKVPASSQSPSVAQSAKFEQDQAGNEQA